jgi:hypothetical protein
MQVALFLLVRASFFEQVAKSFQTNTGHVAELPLVQIPHGLVQRP